MQQAKSKLVLEHLVVSKMGMQAQLRQEELDDLIRYGAAELFAEPAAVEAAAAGQLPTCSRRISEADLLWPCLISATFCGLVPVTEPIHVAVKAALRMTTLPRRSCDVSMDMCPN